MGQTYFANDIMIVNFKDKIVIGQGKEQVTIWKSELVYLLAFFDDPRIRGKFNLKRQMERVRPDVQEQVEEQIGEDCLY